MVLVADEGPGIPDDTKERLFSRVDHGLETSGTEIESYPADRFVRSYEGELWIEDIGPTGTISGIQLARP